MLKVINILACLQVLFVAIFIVFGAVNFYRERRLLKRGGTIHRYCSLSGFMAVAVNIVLMTYVAYVFVR